MRDRDRIVTAAEMADIDRRAQADYGIPGLVLMENAGAGAWRELRRELPDHHRRLVFVAGTGNNGGDALVMARHCLIEGAGEVSIITLRRELSGSVATQWEIVERLGAERTVWNEEPEACVAALHAADWIVDGITGTGLPAPLRPPLVPLVEAMNAAPGRVLAVDVPSGFRDHPAANEPSVVAALTVVTGYLKARLFDPAVRRRAGEIRIVDPGFPPALVRDPAVVGSDIRMMPAEPSHPVPITADVHKGMRGRVVVIGGSDEAGGAAVLAALGVQAAGAGMVRMLGGPASRAAALARDPAIMTGDVRDPAARRDALRWADAAVVGPGWLDLDDETLAATIGAADEHETALVLDAAAIRVLADRGAAWDAVVAAEAPAVLTPHVGEWHGLTTEAGADPPASDIAALQRFPTRRGLAIVVKSATTLLRRDSGSIEVLDGRTPALATAGSGDVLAGLIGGAWARVTASPIRDDERLHGALRWALQRHLEAGSETGAGYAAGAVGLVSALQGRALAGDVPR